MKLFTKDRLVFKGLYVLTALIASFCLIEYSIYMTLVVPFLLVAMGYIFHYIAYMRITKSRLIGLNVLIVFFVSYYYLALTRTNVSSGFEIIIVIILYLFCLKSGVRMYMNDHLLKRSLMFLFSIVTIYVLSLVGLFWVIEHTYLVDINIIDYLTFNIPSLTEGSYSTLRGANTLLRYWNLSMILTVVVLVAALLGKVLKKRA